jgi:hypothetical protein
MTIQPFAGQPPVRGDAPAFAAHDRSRVRAAALHARRIYPGRVGELLQRELSAYAEFGYRFDTDALVPGLVDEILATPTPRLDEAC